EGGAIGRPVRAMEEEARSDRRMAKVLLFSYWPVFTPEGMACSVGLRVWGLAQALARRGHDVRIAEPAQVRPTAAPSPLDARIQLVGWSHDARASRAMIE